MYKCSSAIYVPHSVVEQFKSLIRSQLAERVQNFGSDEAFLEYQATVSVSEFPESYRERLSSSLAGDTLSVYVIVGWPSVESQAEGGFGIIPEVGLFILLIPPVLKSGEDLASWLPKAYAKLEESFEHEFSHCVDSVLSGGVGTIDPKIKESLESEGEQSEAFDLYVKDKSEQKSWLYSLFRMMSSSPPKNEDQLVHQALGESFVSTLKEVDFEGFKSFMKSLISMAESAGWFGTLVTSSMTIREGLWAVRNGKVMVYPNMTDMTHEQWLKGVPGWQEGSYGKYVKSADSRVGSVTILHGNPKEVEAVWGDLVEKASLPEESSIRFTKTALPATASYWISPDGRAFYVGGFAEHWNWIQNVFSRCPDDVEPKYLADWNVLAHYRDYYGSGVTTDMLLNNGWVRVGMGGTHHVLFEIGVSIEEVGGRIRDFILENGIPEGREVYIEGLGVPTIHQSVGISQMTVGDFLTQYGSVGIKLGIAEEPHTQVLMYPRMRFKIPMADPSQGEPPGAGGNFPDEFSGQTRLKRRRDEKNMYGPGRGQAWMGFDNENPRSQRMKADNPFSYYTDSEFYKGEHSDTGR